MSDLVNLTIDGVPVSVPKGTMIIEAAKQAGVLIPHYCYHPGLPVAGVCRMCLVEVEKAPKLQIACATAVAEGQVVKIFTKQATEARKSVLEFLLINHPLDCPICDQAGECELQDFVFQEGRARTRYTPTYAKRFNPVEDFGGDILYVPNRCILCTRCVRFMDHVADDDILNVSERGDRAYIGIHPDKQMDHAWAGNVVDLCPVGSLLSKDFLHKARAWELDHTASVCTGCSQGCNVTLDTRTDVVVRVRPRSNSAVNGHFMCDEGRTLYRGMNRGDRIEAPLVKDGGQLGAVDWDTAFAKAALILKGAKGRAVLLASARASNEALFMTKKLLDGFDVAAGVYVRKSSEKEEPLPGFPNLALRPERSPNLAGARALGFDDGLDRAGKAVSGASVVIVLDGEAEDFPIPSLEGAGSVIWLGTVLRDQARQASVVLPIANVSEEDGSFVNRDKRVQRYFQAKSAPGMARPAWWVAGELMSEAGKGDAASDAADAFSRIGAQVNDFRGLTYASLGAQGVTLGAGAAMAGAAR